MSDGAKFKKEVQTRKKELEGKKIELISRLCSEGKKTEKKNSIQPKQRGI